MPYFLKDNYYVDIDEQNQLRITGPGNHLLLGLTFPAKNPPVIERVREIKGDLSITLAFATNILSFAPPIVTDIRTIRNYTETLRPRPKYKELAQQGISEILPGVVEYYDTEK